MVAPPVIVVMNVAVALFVLVVGSHAKLFGQVDADFPVGAANLILSEITLS